MEWPQQPHSLLLLSIAKLGKKKTMDTCGETTACLLISEYAIFDRLLTAVLFASRK